METVDELKKYVRFLYASLQEKDRENLQMKKDMALEEGANVNVDETWYRYQTHFGHKKTYMWCLVNRKAGILLPCPCS